MSATESERGQHHGRFERAAHRASIAITERDLTIFAHLARHRLLSSEHLISLDGGSAKGVLRRLRALYDEQMLDRPHGQVLLLRRDGTRPLVYALTDKAARLLAHYRSGLSIGSVDWSGKNRHLKPITIEHTLMVADVMVAIECAARRRDDVVLQHAEHIIEAAPEHTRAALNPLKWSTAVTMRGRSEQLSLVPDGAFSLALPRLGKAAHFLLEVDTGTMPIKRRGLSQTSFYRKLLTYYAGWKAGRHVEQFGWSAFRVLTVTSSAARVKSMVEAVQDMTGGRGTGLFCFADRATITGGNPLEIEWMSGTGAGARIAPAF